MVTRHFVGASVSAEIKRRVEATAAADFLSPAAWVRRLTMRALGSQPSAHALEVAEEDSAELRDHRLSVRVSPDDTLLLKARAATRGMRPATYVSVLVRSHLRGLSPLPKDELLALKRAVSELGALTRDLHRIAHLLGQESRGAPEQPDLQAVARLCQTVRSDTKALIRANVDSWEIGRSRKTPGSSQRRRGRSERATIPGVVVSQFPE
jgi:hypothetical protein